MHRASHEISVTVRDVGELTIKGFAQPIHVVEVIDHLMGGAASTHAEAGR